MKHKVLYFALLAMSFALGGCLAEEPVEVEPTDPGDCPIVGEYVSAHLTLDVGDVYVSSTRSEEPDLDNPETDTDAERHVDAIWVFQFDASSLAIVNGGAKFIEITDQTELQDLQTENVLVTNNGDPSIVYVVANVGSTSWVSVSASFTLNDLLETTIPNPEPILTDENGNPASSIPMGGRTEDSVTVSDNARVIVPVYRMFAKLMVSVAVDMGDQDITATPYAIDIGQVANTCTVGSLFTDDATPGKYSAETKFLPWSYSIGDDDSEADGSSDAGGDGSSEDYFIIYVPENIQGEVENTDPDNFSRSDIAPDYALMVTAHLHLYEADGAAIKPDPEYTAYPGGNTTDNFNIRRNCVYRISLSIRPSDAVVPSANCLVCEAGETLMFYPYVRDEIGHTSAYEGTDGSSAEYYTFSNHLAPDGDLAIKGLKILWQSPDCIGDNSGYDRVYMRGSGMQTKIYVETSSEGNALIAAYDDEDCNGNILWSWHIWVTNNHPDDVNNAITYYHYDWDANGVNTDAEVVGYPVMRCNLGALANFPSDAGGDHTQTYGMLYQWGRKDPFPPMRTSGKFGGIYRYTDYTPADDAYYNNTANTVSVSINVYDNSNVKIDLGENDGLKGTGSDYAVFNTEYTSTIDPTFTNQALGITYSIQHPTYFIAPVEVTFKNSDSSYQDGQSVSSLYNNLSSYTNQGDWLPGGDDDLWGGNGKSTKKFQAYNLVSDGFEASVEDNYGEEKTIFDPCPYGWRVSPGDLWLGFTKDGLDYRAEWDNDNTDANLIASVNCKNETVQSIYDDMGFTMYMQGWKGELGSEISFFPTQGSRLANGQPYHGGVCGNYHNATVDETVSVYTDAAGTVVRSGGTQTVTDAIRRVDILHFHGSEFDQYIQVHPFEWEVIYYNRAVAGPLRCVRDTKR